MVNKKKLLEIYAKTSTPQELFIDVIEKANKIEETTNKKIADVNSTFRKALDYIHENKPKSNKELIELIKPLIPSPLKGDTGKTPTVQELIKIMKPLIPPPIPGSPDSPKEIRNKLKSLKGKERLSVFDLKDTEYLKGHGKDRIQWNSIGQQQTTGGGGNFETPSGLIDGLNADFTVIHTPKGVVLNGQWYFENDGYTLSGLTITMLVIPDTGSTLRSFY